jgi:hypothetical protein
MTTDDHTGTDAGTTDAPTDTDVRRVLSRDLAELPAPLHGPAKLYQNATGAMQTIDTWDVEAHINDPSAFFARCDDAQAQVVESVRHNHAEDVETALDAIELVDHPNANAVRDDQEEA